LRERTEDILPLVHFFMDEFNDKYGKHFRRVNAQAERLLLAHSWPGNVRELKNTIERVILLENEDTILASHLHFLVPYGSTEPPDPSAVLRISFPEQGMPLDELEKQIILQAFETCHRNKAKTARFLSIPRHVLLYRLKKLGIE